MLQTGQQLLGQCTRYWPPHYIGVDPVHPKITRRCGACKMKNRSLLNFTKMYRNPRTNPKLSFFFTLTGVRGSNVASCFHAWSMHTFRSSVKSLYHTIALWIVCWSWV
ncbi:hypothetical protein T10_11406 [Trichinella papuae]|uniref:Uncharacterized protein n=1 Tax=Trichinella papuae TaxID=268474 RepID=A0A0V1N7V2_9BILA|nr:hypothetical protein T10_11406 [Trichinella papuae]